MAEEALAHGGAAAPSAGALLRRARESQGMHIAVLAASLKVPQRKLEALERDRIDELPDATFARALAQSVCRVLKVDAAEVLALLPPAGDGGLDQVSTGLNAPFRDKPGQAERVLPAQWLRHPATAIVGLLLVGALAVWLWPQSRMPSATAPADPPASAPTTSPLPAAAVDEAVAPTLPAPVSAAPASPSAGADAQTATGAPPAAAPAASAVSAVLPSAAAAGLLTLRTTAPSWVEVTGADGAKLLSRTVEPAEQVVIDGITPLQLVVGNVAATEVSLRGKRVDLLPLSSNNVARVELK